MHLPCLLQRHHQSAMCSAWQRTATQRRDDAGVKRCHRAMHTTGMSTQPVATAHSSLCSQSASRSLFLAPLLRSQIFRPQAPPPRSSGRYTGPTNANPALHFPRALRRAAPLRVIQLVAMLKAAQRALMHDAAAASGVKQEGDSASSSSGKRASKRAAAASASTPLISHTLSGLLRDETPYLRTSRLFQLQGKQQEMLKRQG